MGFRFLLDSGLHVADGTEAPAAFDVDGAARSVTAEGRWAATWAGNLSSLHSEYSVTYSGFSASVQSSVVCTAALS